MLLSMDVVSIRQEAERQFLGRDHVVGVGLARDRELVFLLDSPFPTAEEKIGRWALENQIRFTIQVVPGMQPA